MDATVVILAGGLGTRIRGVLGDTPKVLGAVAGRPFLGWMLDELGAQGVSNVILLLGHLAARVERFLADNPRSDMVITLEVEPKPLGTLGAVRNAGEDLRGGTIILMNGDTYIDADLNALLARHREAGRMVTMLCVQVDNVSRYGRVELTGDGMVHRFFEKDAEFTGPGTVNAGISVFSPQGIDLMLKSDGDSLERDFLETLPQGMIAAHVVDGAFVDIGTPESYARAAEIMGVARKDRQEPT